MRLHVADLTVDRFLSRKDTLVERLKGDYLMGTRDIVMTAGAMWAMFEHGVPAWVDAIQEHPMGNLARTDLKRIYDDVDRIALRGSLDGSSYWAPEGLTPKEGNVRDSGIATIGSGNHFVEVQVVEEVVDAALAYEWGVRKSQIAFMVHSGSRNVGMYVGKLWHEKARDAWPKGLKYPESRIFPLSYETTPDLVVDYLKAEATAANYAFVNRVLLAELMRIRLREVFGDIDVPLIYDIPHNITLPDGFPNVTTRKGACPAYDGQPVIIPGSMGTASFLCVGKGNQEFLCSASHGAGRSSSRGEMGRFVRDAVHATDLGLDGVECITLREERRIEEAPAAYKDISSVVNAQVQAGIIDVVARMKPILTFKA